MVPLEYSKWEYFELVIKKTKLVCELSNNRVNYHFPVNRKMIKLAKDAIREVTDYKLSGYVCYLIV